VQCREVARPPRASKHDRAPLVRGVFTCFGCVLVVSWLRLLPPLRLTSRGKAKIRSWEKIRTTLKDHFLPPSYLQHDYSKLHNLQQGSLSVEEYIREFKKLLIKCDIQEGEDPTIVRYLSGLDARYANVVELQQYSSFDDVCVLAHRVEQQKKSKPFKRDLPKPPLPKSSPINKGSFQPPPKPTTSLPNPPSKSPTPQNKPPFGTNSNRRCYKC